MDVSFGRLGAACCISILLLASQAVSQPAPGGVSADASQPAPSPTPVAQGSVTIPEGTEIRVHFDERLSSATSAEGDRFTITSDDPIPLANGMVIPAGFLGAGEVTVAKKKGMMGKGGELNIRLDYLRIGPTKLRLRANQGKQGADSTTATVVLTLLFGPIGLIKHGHDIDIAPGQTITAYVDSDTVVPLPLPASPAA